MNTFRDWSKIFLFLLFFTKIHQIFCVFCVNFMVVYKNYFSQHINFSLLLDAVKFSCNKKVISVKVVFLSSFWAFLRLEISQYAKKIHFSVFKAQHLNKLFISLKMCASAYMFVQVWLLTIFWVYRVVGVFIVLLF